LMNRGALSVNMRSASSAIRPTISAAGANAVRLEFG
jgi:hypothetical protein